MSRPETVQIEVPIEGLVEEIIRQLVEDDTLVEVVRCKDCKHFIPDEPCVGGTYTACYELVGGDGCCLPVSEDFYCAYGERRENESI